MTLRAISVWSNTISTFLAYHTCNFLTYSLTTHSYRRRDKYQTIIQLDLSVCVYVCVHENGPLAMRIHHDNGKLMIDI